MPAYYHVSYVTEYPIYEPAEGGYYYAGTTVRHSRRFPSWKKANKYFQKLKRWFLEEHEAEFRQGRVNVYEMSGVSQKWGDNAGSSVRYASRYIGEGDEVVITKGPYQESGWHPYC